MNWSRGLLCAWIAFTVLWFIFIGSMAYKTWPQRQWWEQDAIQHPDPGKTDYLAAITGIDKIGKSTEALKTSTDIDAEYQKSVQENLVMALAMASGLPAALFIVVGALLWIGRGFGKT